MNFRVLSEYNSWVSFLSTQFIESVFFSGFSFYLCDPKKYKLRAVILGLALYNICLLFEFIILWIHPGYFYIMVMIFISIIVPFLYRYLIDSFHAVSDAYSDHECFLVYKRPKSIIGSICALLTAPYGHCSLVVNGQEFKYKKGIMIQRQFDKTNKNLTFINIPSVDILEAKRLLGKEWSLKNNCFTTFRCFKSKNY